MGPRIRSWAAEYGVRRNLVFDHGGAKVVKALGVTSFTTIVFDESGKEVARDRPDRPGYVERVRALADPGPLGARDVQEVVSSKHEVIRHRCWNSHREIDKWTFPSSFGANERAVASRV